MSETHTQRLGYLNGRAYFLAADVNPSWSDVGSFVVTVFYRYLDTDTGHEVKVEVARIDDRSHGHTHFDMLFEQDQPMEAFQGSVWDAWRKLENNWEKYARRYERNHG